MMRRSSLLLSCLVIGTACATEPKTSAPPDDEPAPEPDPAPVGDPDPTPSVPPDAPGVSSDTVADADAHPLAEQSHRHLKRMTVAQTRAVMEQLSGNIPWVDDSGDNLWDVYAETLGVADYQTRLKDNLDPSIMFQKFLDDAAVHTCDAWVVSEAADETGAGRFFTAAGPEATDPTSVTQNLVALRAIVHGETSAATDPIIVNYANLFEVALRRTEDPTAAWTTVCVALFTHPDFFLY